MLFSETCDSNVREEIMTMLEVDSSSFERKYLGLSMPEGRMKDENFQPILERFGKRCNNWNKRFTSQAAKEMHAKAVAQALPTFIMGIFKLTKKFLRRLRENSQKNWWGTRMTDGRCIGCIGKI